MPIKDLACRRAAAPGNIQAINPGSDFPALTSRLAPSALTPWAARAGHPWPGAELDDVTKRSACQATCVNRLPTILLHAGSGMRKTCDRVHLCPPGAREDCALPGAPAAPADLRARVD
jgi:hypothetical protein